MLGIGARAERGGPTYRSGARSFRGAEAGWRGIRLGLSHRQEAFDAELISIMMGLRIMAQRVETGRSSTLFADSQAAMRRTLSDAPGPGQEVAVEIIRYAHRLRTQGNTITIRWVPSHQGVKGNERAYQRAGEAATLPLPRAAIRRQSLAYLRRRATEQAIQIWQDDTRKKAAGRRSLEPPRRTPDQRSGQHFEELPRA